MKLSYYEVKKMPVVVIDDYYSHDACKKIWQELCFLNNDPKKLKPPAETGSAYNIENNEKIMLKNNLALGLDLVYLDRNASSILTENRKLWDEDILLALENLHYFFKFVRYTNKDATLINYYENSHYYQSHRDESTVTTLSFFYKTPKSFAGGNLIIENELNIECLYNRFVIFPSILLHEVEKTTVDSGLEGQNFGRYSITQLMSINV